MTDSHTHLTRVAATRWRLAILLTAAMTLVYVGFILLIAFNKPLLGTILMPGLSGLDTLPSVRALAPGVPVIMVSGAADEQLGRRALASGAFDYVLKPVDLRHLADIVELALVLRPAVPEE